jgi:Fur family ferric uptake transcriptional regulator
MGELAGRLRRRDRKLTGPREAILGVLGRNLRPMSTREIESELPAGSCNLATVYRCMHLLEQMGMVQRFDFGDAVARYELVREGKDEHHHHLVCEHCARIVELDDCFPAEWQERVARESGFARLKHRLEFFGICPDCQRR